MVVKAKDPTFYRLKETGTCLNLEVGRHIATHITVQAEAPSTTVRTSSLLRKAKGKL